MARPREFNIDDAIGKATEVFWTKGYQEASLPDLLEGMGLTRGSLYKAFTDKKTLFLLVLEHYEDRAVAAAQARLSDPGVADGRDRILSLFQASVAAATSGDHRGCLLCTAAAGAEMSDPEIAAAVQRGLQGIREGLETALRASPVHGAQEEAAIRALANVLLTQYIGLRVLARSQLSLGIVEHGVAGVARLLEMS
ncbi:TetR/AcrR family transcriptional regulator [Roseobacter sinensis]|uniref:TetR/AcrR family transcriptional regulator n=1 Tax=Roseobacter sinensis TaxID=2931391 RepID=A0ABT3B8B2_9RHOB|nr:TetR/AcrR family transcriptional regulator [Roseobacter sp. WL0113]MCV3269810.1 TetR/AcrR family transcriptional regulator [Roseobacter sp. WL0113]